MEALPDDILRTCFAFHGNDSYFFIATVCRRFLRARLASTKTSAFCVGQNASSLQCALESGCIWQRQYDLTLVVGKNEAGWRMIYGDRTFPRLSVIAMQYRCKLAKKCLLRAKMDERKAIHLRCNPIERDSQTTSHILATNLPYDGQRWVINGNNTTMLKDDFFYSPRFRRDVYFDNGHVKPFWSVDSVESNWTKSSDCGEIYAEYKKAETDAKAILDPNDAEKELLRVIKDVRPELMESIDDVRALKVQIDQVERLIKDAIDGRKARAVYCERGTDRGHDVQYHKLKGKIMRHLSDKVRAVDIVLRRMEGAAEAYQRGVRDGREQKRSRGDNQFGALESSESENNKSGDSDEGSNIAKKQRLDV